VDAYIAHVDRVLAAGQSLFAASTGPVSLGDAVQESVPSSPPRNGLDIGLTAVRDEYQRNWRNVTALDTHTDGQGAAGKSENERARTSATGVRQTARSQAHAIAPTVRTPAGVRLLVSSMDERLAAMQRQLDTTKTQNRLLATRLHQLATAYRMTAAGPSSLGNRMIRHTGRPGGGITAMDAPRWLPHRGHEVRDVTATADPPTGGAPTLTRNSGPREVAARIIWEAHRRGYSRHQAIAILSTAMQESGLNPKALSPNGLWESIFQQDMSYSRRRDPNVAISEFFDRLGAKGGPASPDIWKSIFWLQQRPAETSAEAAYAHGRKRYLVEIQSQLMSATRLYNDLTR
jgi:hypothetical protein